MLLLPVMPEGEKEAVGTLPTNLYPCCTLPTDLYASCTLPHSALSPILFDPTPASLAALTNPELLLYQFTQETLNNILQGRHFFYQVLASFIARGSFLSQEPNLVLPQASTGSSQVQQKHKVCSSSLQKLPNTLLPSLHCWDSEGRLAIKITCIKLSRFF